MNPDKLEKRNTIIYTYYLVTFPIDEIMNSDFYIFYDKSESEKFSKLPIGYYNSEGNIFTKQTESCDSLVNLSFNESALELAKSVLTIKEFEKYKHLLQ